MIAPICHGRKSLQETFAYCKSSVVKDIFKPMFKTYSLQTKTQNPGIKVIHKNCYK